MDAPDEAELDPYVDFTREEWSRLRASTPLSLAENDLAA
jgi:pantothenate kinase